MAVTMILKNVPLDVYETIISEQFKIKKSRRANQFSMESTIYYIIRSYSKLNVNRDFDMVSVSKIRTKQIYLKKIPADIYKIILTEQNRVKEFMSVNQFSMERTVYHIIREYIKIKSIEIKPCDNAL